MQPNEYLQQQNVVQEGSRNWCDEHNEQPHNADYGQNRGNVQEAQNKENANDGNNEGEEQIHSRGKTTESYAHGRKETLSRKICLKLLKICNIQPMQC